jgi:hypothetical protein
MIRIEKSALENATTKAIAAHCKVRVLGWKRYAVAAPGKAEYTVEFKLLQGGWYGSCNCRAAAHYHACYHCIAAFWIFKIHCQQRSEAAWKRSVAAQGHEPTPYRDGKTCCRWWADRGMACPRTPEVKAYINEQSRSAMLAA